MRLPAAPAFFAALSAFLAGLAFLGAFPFLSATCAQCVPIPAFFFAFGFSPRACVAASSVIAVIVIFLDGVSAIT